MSVLGPMLPMTPEPVLAASKKRLEVIAVSPQQLAASHLPSLHRFVRHQASFDETGLFAEQPHGAPPDRSTTVRTRGRSTPDFQDSASVRLRQASRRVSFTALPLVPGERTAVQHTTSAPSPKQQRQLTSEERLEEIRRQPHNLSPAPRGILALLPPKAFHHHHRNTLLLDIDETLLHASFTSSARYDAKITVETAEGAGSIYLALRPGLFPFLRAVSELFEVAVFTASDSAYAAQVMRLIDPKGFVTHRLSREHCSEVNGTRVKDLSLLGRPLERCILMDNSPSSYVFQPRNAIPIRSWFGNQNDDELMSHLPLLTRLAMTPNVYDLLDQHNARLSSAPRRTESTAQQRPSSTEPRLSTQ